LRAGKRQPKEAWILFGGWMRMAGFEARKSVNSHFRTCFLQVGTNKTGWFSLRKRSYVTFMWPKPKFQLWNTTKLPEAVVPKPNRTWK